MLLLTAAQSPEDTRCNARAPSVPGLDAEVSVSFSTVGAERRDTDSQREPKHRYANRSCKQKSNNRRVRFAYSCGRVHAVHTVLLLCEVTLRQSEDAARNLRLRSRSLFFLLALDFSENVFLELNCPLLFFLFLLLLLLLLQAVTHNPIPEGPALDVPC